MDDLSWNLVRWTLIALLAVPAAASLAATALNNWLHEPDEPGYWH